MRGANTLNMLDFLQDLIVMVILKTINCSQVILFTLNLVCFQLFNLVVQVSNNTS